MRSGGIAGMLQRPDHLGDPGIRVDPGLRRFGGEVHVHLVDPG